MKKINGLSKKMTIKELQKESYQIAKDKGWHDEGKDKSPLEYHMLMVSEIAEATEEVRNRKPPLYKNYEEPRFKPQIILPDNPEWNGYYQAAKLEGELAELSDVVIRIADYCEHMGFDLEEAIKLKTEYNKSRTYRHGNKLL